MTKLDNKEPRGRLYNSFNYYYTTARQYESNLNYNSIKYTCISVKLSVENTYYDADTADVKGKINEPYKFMIILSH